MDQSIKTWYEVRAKEFAKLPQADRFAYTLGTLQGILSFDDLPPEEIVERQRYFLSQVDKAVEEEKRYGRG